MINIFKFLPFLKPKFGTGWLPNDEDARDWDFETLGLSMSTLESVSLRRFVKAILNQRNTSSCVAHAIAGAIAILEAAAGLPVTPVSVLFLYFNGRRFHSDPVTDSGTFIRLAIKGLLKFGVPDSYTWPFSTKQSVVNQRPTWDPYMKAFGRRGGDYYAIKSFGKARVEAIKSALANGFPVVFGTPIAQSFKSSAGPSVIDRPTLSEPIAGNHAMMFIGYRTQVNGTTEFEVVNSWGTGWRNGGMCWFTEDYVTWTKLGDLTIIKGWEKLRKARAAA